MGAKKRPELPPDVRYLLVLIRQAGETAALESRWVAHYRALWRRCSRKRSSLHSPGATSIRDGGIFLTSTFLCGGTPSTHAPSGSRCSVWLLRTQKAHEASAGSNSHGPRLDRFP